VYYNLLLKGLYSKFFFELDMEEEVLKNSHIILGIDL
jgi:hypothetical protein